MEQVTVAKGDDSDVIKAILYQIHCTYFPIHALLMGEMSAGVVVDGLSVARDNARPLRKSVVLLLTAS
jgi:hypothetical protein